MTYTLHVSRELFWFVLTAVVMTVAQVLVTLKPEDIADWRVWLVSLLGAIARAAGGALLSFATSKPSDEDREDIIRSIMDSAEAQGIILSHQQAETLLDNAVELGIRGVTP